jgi:hypothetical protein
MSSISATLSRQSYEMAIHLIGTEILNASNSENNQEILNMMSRLSSDSSSEDEDEMLYLVLLKQVLSQ